MTKKEIHFWCSLHFYFGQHPSENIGDIVLFPARTLCFRHCLLIGWFQFEFNKSTEEYLVKDGERMQNGPGENTLNFVVDLFKRAGTRSTTLVTPAQELMFLVICICLFASFKVRRKK